jgi:transcriptional regulator with XRE-family HTH domain
MNYTNKLLDKYREKCSIKTDMGAAESLGLGRSAISGWRHGNRHAEADAVEKMAKAIGEPVQKWLHLIEAERARTPAAAKVWLRLAQAAASITLGYIALKHPDAHQILSFAPITFIHYAQSRVARSGALRLARSASGTSPRRASGSCGTAAF